MDCQYSHVSVFVPLRAPLPLLMSASDGAWWNVRYCSVKCICYRTDVTILILMCKKQSRVKKKEAKLFWVILVLEAQTKNFPVYCYNDGKLLFTNAMTIASCSYRNLPSILSEYVRPFLLSFFSVLVYCVPCCVEICNV